MMLAFVGAAFLGYAISAFVASQIIGTIADTISTSKKIDSQKRISEITAKVAREAAQLKKDLQEKLQAQAAETTEKAEGQIEGMRRSAGRKQSQQERRQLAMATNPGSFMPSGAAYSAPPQQSPYGNIGRGGGGGSPMAALLAGGPASQGPPGPQFSGTAGTASGTEALEAMLEGVSPEYAQETLAAAGGRAPTMLAGLRGHGIDIAELLSGHSGQDEFA